MPMTTCSEADVREAAMAICQEMCAYRGEAPCWRIEGEWPPKLCDDPGCMTLARVALDAVTLVNK